MPENVAQEPSFQDQLKADREGTFRRQVVDELSEVSAEIKRSENQGLAQEEFKAIGGLKAAVEEAKEVVNKAWEVYHTSSRS